MAVVFVNLYRRLKTDLGLPKSIRISGYTIERLKSQAPDDGEALNDEGKYCIHCSDEGWKDVIETLRLSGKSLVYSVILSGTDGEPIILEAGELNSEVEHYTTRLRDVKQIFSFWFEEFLPPNNYLRAT